MPIAEQSVRKPSRVYLRRGHPLTRGLVSAWPFYEGAGGTLRSISGQTGLDGTLTNSPTWTVTPAGIGLSFTKSNTEYVDITLDIDSLTSMTVVSLFQTDFDTSGQARSNCMLSWGEDGSFGELPILVQTVSGTSNNEFSADNKFGSRPADGSDVTYLESSDSINDGKPHVGASVLDGSGGGEALIYLDGEEVDSSTNWDGFGNPSSTCHIADYVRVNDGFYHGEIMLILVYDYALPPGAIQSLTANPLLPFITKPR